MLTSWASYCGPGAAILVPDWPAGGVQRCQHAGHEDVSARGSPIQMGGGGDHPCHVPQLWGSRVPGSDGASLGGHGHC